MKRRKARPPKPMKRDRPPRVVRTDITISDTAQTNTGFPIVGLGASAGALDAFTRFFTVMPPDSGMAFVLIQHIDPTHESLTAELLSRHTKMSVMQVKGEMAVEPNHVYVIPPNRYLSMRDGKLQLTSPEKLPRLAAAPRTPGVEDRLADTVRQLILDRFAPASVVINRRLEIVHFTGATHKYLMQPPGAGEFALATVSEAASAAG